MESMRQTKSAFPAASPQDITLQEGLRNEKKKKEAERKAKFKWNEYR